MEEVKMYKQTGIERGVVVLDKEFKIDFGQIVFDELPEILILLDKEEKEFQLVIEMPWGDIYVLEGDAYKNKKAAEAAAKRLIEMLLKRKMRIVIGSDRFRLLAQ